MSSPHDDLQRSLADARRSLGEVVAEKVGLGSWGGSAQIDVATMKPSWANPNPTAYEVKVSRSDFLTDTQAGKYRKYLPYVRRLYFAAPAGLLSKGEIPDGMGLIVRGDNGWHVQKAPRIQTPDPAMWPVFLQALLMKHYPGPWSRPEPDRRARIAAAEAEPDDSLAVRGLRLSARVRRVMDEAEDARRTMDWSRSALAQMAGVEANGRPISDLVRAVLDGRPYRDPPDLHGIRLDLDTIRRAADRIDERAIKLDTDGAA
jgi:hypothetical protein